MFARMFFQLRTTTIDLNNASSALLLKDKHKSCSNDAVNFEGRNKSDVHARNT